MRELRLWSAAKREQETRLMLDRFVDRHVKLKGFLLGRFEEVREQRLSLRNLSGQFLRVPTNVWYYIARRAKA